LSGKPLRRHMNKNDNIDVRQKQENLKREDLKINEHNYILIAFLVSSLLSPIIYFKTNPLNHHILISTFLLFFLVLPIVLLIPALVAIWVKISFYIEFGRNTKIKSIITVIFYSITAVLLVAFIIVAILYGHGRDREYLELDQTEYYGP